MDWVQVLDVVVIPLLLAVIGYFWNAMGKQEAEMQTLRKQLSDWQLQVVATYATKSEVEKMEARIMTALERLDIKMERVLDRFTGHGD